VWREGVLVAAAFLFRVFFLAISLLTVLNRSDYRFLNNTARPFCIAIRVRARNRLPALHPARQILADIPLDLLEFGQ
jgi:hypothetical protein